MGSCIQTPDRTAISTTMSTLFSTLLVIFSIVSAMARPQEHQSELPKVQDVEQVVDSVARLARSLDPTNMETSSSNNKNRFTRQAPLMPYRYGYAVQDDIGNDFNQQEQSDGNVITGQYSVLLPDGRVQTVTYSVAPDTGFVAEVTYS